MVASKVGVAELIKKIFAVKTTKKCDTLTSSVSFVNVATSHLPFVITNLLPIIEISTMKAESLVTFFK